MLPIIISAIPLVVFLICLMTVNIKPKRKSTEPHGVRIVYRSKDAYPYDVEVDRHDGRGWVVQTGFKRKDEAEALMASISVGAYVEKSFKTSPGVVLVEMRKEK